MGAFFSAGAAGTTVPGAGLLIAAWIADADGTLLLLSSCWRRGPKVDNATAKGLPFPKKAAASCGNGAIAAGKVKLTHGSAMCQHVRARFWMRVNHHKIWAAEGAPGSCGASSCQRNTKALCTVGYMRLRCPVCDCSSVPVGLRICFWCSLNLSNASAPAVASRPRPFLVFGIASPPQCSPGIQRTHDNSQLQDCDVPLRHRVNK